MQNKTDDDTEATAQEKPVEPKHVGDETANPLPDHDYSTKQPSNDDNQANSDSDSSVK